MMGLLQRLILCVFVLVSVFATSGCTLLAVGAVGAVGGYVISPDTVEGITSFSQEELWDAAHDVVSIMGYVEENNELMGQITAIVNGARVEVTVIPVNLTTSKLTIKARKTFMPRIALAQDVYAKIIGSLEE